MMKIFRSSLIPLLSVLTFSDNRGRLMDNFSRVFKANFVALLRRRWRTKRVKANKVYQTHISDKTHVHLNATCWSTVSGFIKHLADEGIVVAEETEKGLLNVSLKSLLFRSLRHIHRS